MDDNDEPWLSETDHRTGWNKEFKSGTYSSMLCGFVSRDYPTQVVPLAKAKSVPANMLEFFSWAQNRYRTDVTAPTVEPKKQVSRHLLVRAQVEPTQETHSINMFDLW